MEGRVEIYYNREWGTVCGDFWDLRDAIVVCRQLGYTTAARRSVGAEFGQGTGRIWRDDVDCSGSESRLSSCSARYWGITNCYHSNDAGVVCASKLCELARCAYTTYCLGASACTCTCIVCVFDAFGFYCDSQTLSSAFSLAPERATGYNDV